MEVPRDTIYATYPSPQNSQRTAGVGLHSEHYGPDFIHIPFSHLPDDLAVRYFHPGGPFTASRVIVNVTKARSAAGLMELSSWLPTAAVFAVVDLATVGIRVLDHQQLRPARGI